MLAQIRFLDEQTQAAAPLLSGRFDLFSIAVILAVLWLIGYGIYKARLMPKLTKQINWRPLVVAMVLSVWIGHVYGHVRYRSELALVSNQQTLRYLNEIVGVIPNLSTKDRDRWCYQATVIAFFSVWLLLIAKARRE